MKSAPPTPPVPDAAPDAAPEQALPRTASPAVQRLRALTLAGLVALIALGLAWELWLAPTGSGTLALKVVPLVLCLLGLLRHRMSTYRWLALLLWLYVLEGLVRATTETGLSQALAVAQTVLCLLLFSTATVYIRSRLKTKAAAAAMTT